MRAWRLLLAVVVPIVAGVGAAPALAGFAPGPGSPFTTQVDGANSVAVGDLNRDGILDIATPGSGNGGTEGRLATFLGNGSGGFSKPAGNPFAFGAFPGATSIVLRDLTADGVPESIVSHDRGAIANAAADGRVTVRVGNGAGGIPAAGANLTTGGDRTVGAAVADVRGTAFPDVVAVDRRGFNDTADPTFHIASGLNTTPTFGNTLTNAVGFANDHDPGGIAVADLDGDGAEDMAATVGDGRIVTLKGAGGSFQNAITRRSGSGILSQILAPDVDGDGDRDLVTALRSDVPALIVLRNNGQGAFSEAQGSPFVLPGGEDARGVAAGDLTGDGRLDVAVAHPMNRRVSVMAGTGAGRFVPAPGSPFSTEPVEQPAGVAIGDFDRDLHPDLAVSHNENAARLTVLLNDGKGRAVFAGTSFGTGPIAPRTRTVTVGNVGTGVLRITGVGTPGDGYEVVSNGCTAKTIPVGATCPIGVRFTGTTPRLATRPLSITTHEGSFATTLSAVTRAPLLSKVGLSRKRFRGGRGRGRGTRIRFTLSEAASVKIGFERAVPGRRSAGKCRRPTRRLVRRRATRCIRFVGTRLRVNREGKAGENSVVFRGRAGRRRLRTGRHRLLVVASDDRGNRSARLAAGFRLLRSRR